MNVVPVSADGPDDSTTFDASPRVVIELAWIRSFVLVVELRHEIHDYVKDLTTEIQNFRQSTFGRTIRKWGPFSLGGFVTIAAVLSGQVWALPLVGASVLFGAAEKAGVFERKASKRDEMVRLIAAARKEIISSVSSL